jgi:hypothetical protein
VQVLGLIRLSNSYSFRSASLFVFSLFLYHFHNGFSVYQTQWSNLANAHPRPFDCYRYRIVIVLFSYVFARAGVIKWITLTHGGPPIAVTRVTRFTKLSARRGTRVPEFTLMCTKVGVVQIKYKWTHFTHTVWLHDCNGTILTPRVNNEIDHQ